MELANQNKSISINIKSKISPYLDDKNRLNDSYSKLLTKKINFAEKNKIFLKQLNIRRGLIRYVLALNNTNL